MDVELVAFRVPQGHEVPIPLGLHVNLGGAEAESEDALDFYVDTLAALRLGVVRPPLAFRSRCSRFFSGLGVSIFWK